MSIHKRRKISLSSGASSAFQFTFASDTLEIESLVMDSQISREKQSNEVDDSLRRPMRTEFSENGSKFQRFIEYFSCKHDVCLSM